jgi:predicted O-methyltransferase YrrM
MRNVFACLVHERPECVVDLVRNLRRLDPDSLVLLYNGGQDLRLLDAGFPFGRHGAVVHPTPRALVWGMLHDFALDCMRFALEALPFDTLTIVDSDQLATRPGYAAYLARALAERTGVGVLGSAPGVHRRPTRLGPVEAALDELPLWRPFLRRFPCGEEQFVHWTFWPSTVFTADAARELTKLFATDAELADIMRRSHIWATEEVILPTLAALLGFRVEANPCSYDYVRFRVAYEPYEVDAALARPDVFWMHPVPRRYDDPIRARIRTAFEHYGPPAAAAAVPAARVAPVLLLTAPIIARMRQVEGWLDDEEADLLVAAMRWVLARSSEAVVEVGSYCGRATVVLASVVKQLGSAARVYSVDTHDGVVGAADTGLERLPPTLEKFRQNLRLAGVEDVVERIVARGPDTLWSRPIAFLLVDGLHDYPSVAADFHHFEPWLADGALVAFHDYADYYPGVKALVDNLAAGGDWELMQRAASLVLLRRRPGPAGDAPARPVAAREEPAPAPLVMHAPVGRLVSCIMPTANRRAFIPQAIRYFQRQDYEARELIILDDGADSVADLVPRDPRIRYVRMDERRTMGAKHNLACDLAQGEIICHWDDDDWMADWRLSYQIRELLSRSPSAICGLAHLLFYDPRADRAWRYRHPDQHRPWIGGGTLVYRRSFWESHRFPDMNEGADTIFIWGLTDAEIVALPDERFYVAIVHAANTSPKRTDGPGWDALGVRDIRALLGEDWEFYAE